VSTDNAVRPAPTQTKGARTASHGRAVVAILVAVLVLGGLAAKGWYDHRASDVRFGTTSVDTDGMAARYGIHVDMIAVTAAGGLVELRYQVVDPDKAIPLVHDRDLSPALVNEQTGETLRMSSPPHHHGTELDLGGTYFFLMANTRSAMRSGDRVTLVVGDARLEHLVTQG
jgi:hypothetical protein